jgi:hypothetical protein
MPQKGKQHADTVLLTALACGATREVAARQAGVSESTVFRRLRDAEFCRKLKDLRAEMVERTAGMLTAASMESVRTLVELQKPAQPAAVRLGAAKAVLEIGLKLRELTEEEQRLAALEEQFAGGQAA